jgi:hypothetical protein
MNKRIEDMTKAQNENAAEQEKMNASVRKAAQIVSKSKKILIFF